MLIVMRHGAAQEDIDRVVATIEEMGYQARPMPGKQRTTVGLVGQRRPGGRVPARRAPRRAGNHPRHQAVQAGFARVEGRVHRRPAFRRAQRRRRRGGGDGGTLLGGKRATDPRCRARGAGGGRDRAARRRLQAAQLALLLPGPGPRRASAARPSAGGDRAADRDRGDGRRGARSRCSRSPTSSRSARGTCRTTRCSSTPAAPESRSC